MSLDPLSCCGSGDFLFKYLRSRFNLGDFLHFSVTPDPHTVPVIYVSSGGAPRLVIKLIASFRRFLKVVCRFHFMSRHGLPVPRLLGWTTIGRFGPLRSYVLVQEYIGGRKPVVEERDLNKLAQAFAALHSISRTTMGNVNPALKRGGYFKRDSYIRFRLRQTLSRLTALQGHMRPSEAERLGNALAESAAPMWRRSRYELVHADVKPHHYVLTEQFAIILDLDEVHFGNFACDLVSALHLLCGDEQDKKQLFLAAYFRCVRGVTRSEFAAFEPFYHADYHLRAAGHAVRELMEQRIGQNDFDRLFERELNCCQQALAPGIAD